MCRNIIELRGLQPPATEEEVAAAALQYVRKVTGLRQPSAATASAIDDAVREISAVTSKLLHSLPDRARPPSTVPPLRRPEVRARIAARAERGAGCPMKVRIDEDKCEGHGRCYATAPAVFEPDELGDGHEIGDGTVPPELEDRARLAVANCPEQAISVEAG